MKARANDADFLGKESIGRIMWKLTPPVMLAQLVQGLYNIVDSAFVGQCSGEGLTGLSVVFPLQLIICALAVGTGVGVNTYMARLYAQDEEEKARQVAGVGILLAILSWALFAVISAAIMRPYATTGARSEEAINAAVTYGNIVCIGSLGTFLESMFSKIHQSKGNMRLPVIAQITGAAVNIILDPILIFGFAFIPGMGVAGAAIATVAGQFTTAAITAFGAVSAPSPLREMGKHIKTIYLLGYPSILMQSLYTVYIVVLNAILATFSDAAVTVLGLYYKLQTFFFIPINGLQVCIVPVLSYNFTQKAYKRCEKTMNYSLIICLVVMAIGFICFVFFPHPVISVFSSEAAVHEIGGVAFPIIGCGFFSACFSLMLPVFFQAIGRGIPSAVLSVCRQIVCLPSLFYLFSLIGLNYTWIAFPAAETISGVLGLILYLITIRRWRRSTQEMPASIPIQKEECL